MAPLATPASQISMVEKGRALPDLRRNTQKQTPLIVAMSNPGDGSPLVRAPTEDVELTIQLASQPSPAHPASPVSPGSGQPGSVGTSNARSRRPRRPESPAIPGPPRIDAEEPASTSSTESMRAWQACENPRCQYGYPEFVKFMSTANNFSIFRSFDRLNNRMILRLQEELRVIEKDWDDLDRNAVRQGVSRGSLQVDEVNDALSDDEQEPNGESGANRKQCLVNRTIDKVMLYNRFLNSYEQLKQHPPAQDRDIASIKTWLDNRQKYREPNSQEEPEGPIREEERQYLLAPDCVALLPTANPTRLRRALEKSENLRWLKCFRKDVHPSLDQSYALDDYQLRDDAKVDLAVEAVAVIAGLVTFVVPLWVLTHVEDLAAKLGISTVLMPVFWVVLLFGTNARSETRIAGCAAYMTVLIAIIQITR